MIRINYRSWRTQQKERRRLRGRARGLASARVTRARCAAQEINTDTLRRRALYDAKGQTVREGATFRASGVTHWCVRRSVAGSVRQFDFIANGVVKLTAGRRRFPLRIRPN